MGYNGGMYSRLSLLTSCLALAVVIACGDTTPPATAVPPTPDLQATIDASIEAAIAAHGQRRGVTLLRSPSLTVTGGQRRTLLRREAIAQGVMLTYMSLLRTSDYRRRHWHRWPFKATRLCMGKVMYSGLCPNNLHVQRRINIRNTSISLGETDDGTGTVTDVLRASNWNS